MPDLAPGDNDSASTRNSSGEDEGKHNAAAASGQGGQGVRPGTVGQGVRPGTGEQLLTT